MIKATRFCFTKIDLYSKIKYHLVLI